MRKFAPLDLSFLSDIGSLPIPQRQSFRNNAEEIKARMGLGPSYTLLQDIKKAQEMYKAEVDAEAAKHKPTFLSGFFDLLSTPLYGIANAADEAIAGHQSDPNDSVLSDIGQVIGGIGTGLPKGLGAGLRGATSMLDALPAVDIPDDWQARPTDKTRFGDVYTRLTAKMSTADAMKPENWAAAKANIEGEKQEAEDAFGSGIADFFYGDLNSANAQEDFIRRMKLLGIAGDIGLDPTTYAGFGLFRGGAKGAEAITEGVDAARVADKFTDLARVPDTFRAPIGKPRAGELPFSAATPGGIPLPGRVSIPGIEKLNTPAAITAPKIKATPGALPTVPVPAPIVATTPEAIAEIGGKIRPTTPFKVKGTNRPGTENFKPDIDRAIGLLKNNMLVDQASTFLTPVVKLSQSAEAKIINDFKARFPGMAFKDILKNPQNEAELRALLDAHFAKAKPTVAPTPPAVVAPDNAGNEALFAQLLDEVLTEGSRVDDVIASAGIAATSKPKIKTTASLTKAQQNSIVKEISDIAASGKKGWVYQAAEVLGRYPHLNFENASRFLDLAHKRGGKIPARAFSSTLALRIMEDAVKSSRPGDELVEAVRKASVEKIIKPGESALNANQARIANNLIAKHSPLVFGTKAPVGMGENYAKSIARGDTAIYSGPKQANIWNELATAYAYAGNERYGQVVATMKAINNHFEKLGAIAHSAASISGKNAKKGAPAAVPLRLDQVAEAIGPSVMGMSREFITDILAGVPKAMATLTAEQQAAIKALRESSAVTAMAAAKEAVKGAEEATIAIATSIAPKAEKAASYAKLPDLTAEAAAAAGAGDAAAKFAKYYISTRLKDVNPIDDLFRASSTDTLKSLATTSVGLRSRVVDSYFAARVTRAISKAEKLPDPKGLGKFSGPGVGVKDWLGARFNAAYGMKNMNPIMRANQAAALTTMAHNTRYMNRLAREYSPKDVDLWHEAFRAAQMDSLTTGRVLELQKEVSKIMKDLVGGSGLKATAIADTAVAARSRLTMNELNEQLRRFGLGEFQFSNKKKVLDYAGNAHDLSKGIDWMKSWELWNVKKPYEFMQRFQQAIETTVRNKTMFDEIAARFGSATRHRGVKYGINHPRLDGYFFTKEGAQQGEQFVKVLKEINSPAPKSLQYLDNVISKMKAALTIYFPSHHWTNLIGDTMFNWFAGVNDPRRYTQAMKVMQSQKGRYGDMATFRGKVMGPEAELQSIARGVLAPDGLASAGLSTTPMGNSIATTMKNGTKVTNDMIYVAAMQRGILPSARVLEEVTSDVSSILDKFKPLGGRGQAAAHVVSEVRDHIPRLAQFIDGIAKSNGNFLRAADDSAAAVRKWHPDGLDLTKFERDVMKRIFPFYSWTRKAIPLAIQASLAVPAKVMAYPHLMEGIALSNGITPGQGTIGEFPTDQMFPDWLRERGIGPVAGGPGDYTIVNPSTPVLDIMTMLGHPGQTGLDMLNPYAKVPLELMQGATLGKQVPIENEMDYLARQVPGVSHAGRITGYYGTSDSVANSEQQKFYNLLNLLTGAKATQSGIYQKSAQFDLRDYLKERKEASGN